jgi:ribosomal protein L34E
MVKEDTERHADAKMVKVKTPEGKVVWRKQRTETEVAKGAHNDC